MQSRFLIKPNYLNEQKHQSHKNKKMNNLKKNRLNKLNKLLMEQERPDSMKRAAARRNRGDAKQPPKKDDDEGFLSEATSTIVSLYEMKQARGILMAVIEKAGPEGRQLADTLIQGTKASRSARVLSFFRNLGPRGVTLSKRIAQETVMTLARRGPGKAVLKRIMTNPSIARFVTKRLGISLLSSGVPMGSATIGLATTGGQTALGAASAGSIAAAILGGAAIGTAIGYGLNKALNAADLEGEVKERLEKAKKDINYAKAELDIYCQGRGPLCGDEVKCSGKSGGYVYDIAGEEGMYGLGRGAGRELFGVPGFRKFKQLAHQFHSNDGAMMIGLAAALASHDLKNDKIVLPNKENKLKVAKFKPGAASKQYEKCLKKWLTKSNVMLSQAKKLGMTEPYEALRLVYGIDAFPSDLPDKKPGASPTPDSGKGPRKCDNYPITKGCVGDPVGNLIYIAVGGTKSGPDMCADSTNEFNQAEVEKLIDAGVLNDKVIKLVSQILKAEGALDVLKTWKANNFTIKSGDKVDRWLDVTASRKGMTENLDFYRKLKKSKSDKLANILMEGIK